MTNRKPPKLFTVPCEVKAQQCTGAARGGSCTKPIYWIETGGRRVPVDCDVPNGIVPLSGDSLFGDGMGREPLHHVP